MFFIVMLLQVVHKAQTIFQNNAKYEAELIHLREEVSETRASMLKLDAEKKYLVCQLQSALLENHKLRVNPKQQQEKSDDKVCQDIQIKLANEMATIQSCLLYTSPSPRDRQKSRMPSSA